MEKMDKEKTLKDVYKELLPSGQSENLTPEDMVDEIVASGHADALENIKLYLWF